ncbi:LysR family transcriptional regulator [Pandoraea sp. PE-S2R-1]|uniref:LysR family transcriptional regulator n=1 Tax=Pandoraea sp. PE-S2R-1 TaxID=1986994 RepID=UPI000B406390|nr:LysR family transcriptional regulator [Pandoraea sp. PE-S2R-1]
MVNFNRFASFVALIDAGSFTRAAQILGVTKAMVSADLKRLEAELGVSLVTRTTRRLALTEVGERFHRDCVRLIGEAELAIQQARDGQETLKGTLRVTSTAEYGLNYVLVAIAEFSAIHPELRIEYSTLQHQADLIAQRFDVAVRLGTLRDSTLRATPLQKFSTVPVATRAYLVGKPEITTPDDLARLEWIEHARFTSALTWTELRTGKTMQTPHFKGALEVDTANAALTLVLAGCGAAILPDWLLENDLRDELLIRLVPNYSLPYQGAYAVFPNTAHVPAKVRKFIDFMRDFLRRTM